MLKRGDLDKILSDECGEDEPPPDIDELVKQLPDDIRKELDDVTDEIAQGIVSEAMVAGADEVPEEAVEEVPSIQTKVEEKRPESETPISICDGNVTMLYVKRAGRGSARIAHGSVIGFRAQEDEPLQEEVFGGPVLPWALEEVATRLSIGEVVVVTARGEYALADNEQTLPDAEKQWHFELVTVGNQGKDKFQLTADERIERATELRERGNAMLKKGRLLRAANHYERGSALMDIIEAEDMGMGQDMGGMGMPGMPGMAGMQQPGMQAMQGALAKKDEKAVATNKRIRACQLPLLCNWGLVLMKLGKYYDAERKLTEVLLDIDKQCVKALFRRGQCQIELGNLEEARADLKRAQELDQSTSAEVERELAKLGRRQKAQDAKDKGWAKKMLKGALGDDRSEAKAVASSGPTGPSGTAKVADDENEGLDIRVKESSATRVNASTPQSPALGNDLQSILAAQDKRADQDGVDELTWCRQREAIYNQFIKHAPADG